MKIVALKNQEAPSLDVSNRIKQEIVYFATASNSDGLATEEYTIDVGEARRILDQGVLHVVSPLRAENAAEVEISEDAERLLEWVLEYDIHQIRLCT